MTGDDTRPGSQGSSSPGTAGGPGSGHDSAGFGGQGRTTEEAEHKARQTVDKARNQLHSILNDQKQAAAGQIESVAKAMRSSAEELRSQDQQAAAGYVQAAADALSNWCETLRERDIDSFAGQLQTFAKRQPVVFIAGAAVVGFAATRFLKSSELESREVRESSPRELPNSATGSTSIGSSSAPVSAPGQGGTSTI